MDRFAGSPATVFAQSDGKVDHHDGVFLDDSDQQEDPDHADDVQFHTEEDQAEDRTDAGRGEGREDGDRVDQTFVEDA